MTRIISLDRHSIEDRPFTFDFPHQLTEHQGCAPEAIADLIQGHDILITNKIPVTAATLDANPQLKMIAIAATGYNHVDVAAARERGVVVSNIRAYGNDTVAEHAFMLMMALMRQLPAYQRDVAAGLWQKANTFCHFGAPMRDLSGKTLAIFGKGGIGQALAKRALAFDMKVIYGEHKGAVRCRDGYVLFDEAISSADVVSLHCPLNADTHNMIDEAALQQMKPGAVLINVSRGGLVDELALVAALKYGQLGGAGVDVLTEEPPVNGNPLLKAYLPHLIVTPHMAWGTVEARNRLFEILCDNVNQFMAGTPKNVL
ncbi:MAG: D-2-hydroxyacid dehydrogenase [Neisseriaceae bacterium]|nr:D-2-hydroxyacid dehydrogenase [Neisseriaceae bacterium]